MRIESPGGAHFAELTEIEESAGCHGVGGYHSTHSVLCVYDSTRREVWRLERTFTHTVSENAPDDYSGTVIRTALFTAGGKAIEAVMGNGERVVFSLE